MSGLKALQMTVFQMCLFHNNISLVKTNQWKLIKYLIKLALRFFLEKLVNFMFAFAKC